MSASWVAGSVRAKALARRRVGAAAARSLAAATLEEAVGALAETPYGRDVRATHSLADAQHGVAATLLWHLRVLSGWLPRDGVDMVRSLSAAFEIANVDEHVRGLLGHSVEPPFRLGTLATAWGRLSRTANLTDLRATLASSAWGDTGGETPAAIHLGMRLSWLVRVASTIPAARPWTAGAAALIIARERFVAQRPVAPILEETVRPLLGPGASSASTLADFAAAISPESHWALDGIDDPTQLWWAEAAWWRRLQRDGFALLQQPRFSADPVLGAVAVLAADAWRVRAALEAAARGSAVEVFDAVA